MDAAPTEIEVRAGGRRFRALEWPARGPLALLLHATSFCADTWGPVWEAARAAGAEGWRAVAVDQRGHGGSFAPDAPDAYAWSQLAGDLCALLEALAGAAGDSLLVGHSSGATACLVAAGMCPERVGALAVVEPVLFDPPAGSAVDSFAGSRALAERARKRRSRFPTRAVARETLASRFPGSGFAASALDAYLDGGFSRADDDSLALRCDPQVEAWAYAGAASLDLWPHAARIRAPLLVLAAEHSAVPPALLERLERAAPDVRVERVAGATHFAALERPEEVGARLGRFAAGLRA